MHLLLGPTLRSSLSHSAVAFGSQFQPIKLLVDH